MIKKFVNWLVLSSKNPGEVGLTTKAVLLAIIPVVSMALGLAHIDVGADVLTSVVDTIIGLVQGVLAVVSAIGVVWGLVRKLWATFNGTHATMMMPKNQ